MKHPLSEKPTEVAALIAAIRMVNHYHNLSDAIYDVRERHGHDDGYTGDSWEHPKVLAFGKAVGELKALGALDPLPTKPTTAKTLTASLVAEAFDNFRFQVTEEDPGRAYIAEVPIKLAAESEGAVWWASRGNKGMARVEAVRWAESQALQMAARAFGEAAK